MRPVEYMLLLAFRILAVGRCGPFTLVEANFDRHDDELFKQAVQLALSALEEHDPRRLARVEQHVRFHRQRGAAINCTVSFWSAFLHD
jgi:hypothetical protein